MDDEVKSSKEIIEEKLDKRASGPEQEKSPEQSDEAPKKIITSESQQENKESTVTGRICPMNKQVLVRIEAELNVTKGGIILPEHRERAAPTAGIVLAVSEDCGDDTKEKLKEGTRVIFSKYTGVEIDANKNDPNTRGYQLIHEDKILARFVIVKKDENGEVKDVEMSKEDNSITVSDEKEEKKSDGE